jgi:hypothetical protein
MRRMLGSRAMDSQQHFLHGGVDGDGDGDVDVVDLGQLS